MDPRVRCHGMKANPTGYLWSRYECFLMSGCQDMDLKANPDYKRLKQVPNLIISLDKEVSTPLQLSNTPQNPITDLIGYCLGEYTCILLP